MSFLPDPVDSSYPLFDGWGVPGDVVVDDGRTELEVQGFGCGFGADEDAFVGLAQLAYAFFPGGACGTGVLARNAGDAPRWAPFIRRSAR